MAEPLPSKQAMRVRSPSPAPLLHYLPNCVTQHERRVSSNTCGETIRQISNIKESIRSKVVNLLVPFKLNYRIESADIWSQTRNPKQSRRETLNENLISKLDTIIDAKSLLKHPFYQDWSAGRLTMDSLRTYAAQYYHFESAFPTILSSIHSRCEIPEVRQLILNNLWDEEHGEDNHRALWLRFCRGLGLDEDEVISGDPLPETQGLVNSYQSIARTRSYQEGMAAMYAYERQIPAVATKKTEGLVEFYGIDDPEVIEFFTVHKSLDEEHAAAESQAIGRLGVSPSEAKDVLAAADEALDTLWMFLDGVRETA